MVCDGDTSKFTVGKPHSASDVVGGFNKANLNNFIVLGHLGKQPSKHITKYVAWGWLVLY